jgi:hypothetical protein
MKKDELHTSFPTPDAVTRIVSATAIAPRQRREFSLALRYTCERFARARSALQIPHVLNRHLVNADLIHFGLKR